MIKTKPVAPTPTVYSYYMPEVREIVQENLHFMNHMGDEDFGQIGHWPQGIHSLLSQNYDPGLDTLHEPLMEKYEQFARGEGVIGLDTFPNKYYTNGSSEGIFHLLSYRNGRRWSVGELFQLDGEYQGYKEYGRALGVNVQNVPSLEELNNPYYQPGIVILSNPASHDGNIRTDVLNYILNETGHDVILDLAYMGMTQKPLNIDLSNPRIVAVVGSLSKPFGLYYYRIGFCYSRWKIDSLFGNKWFKNALSIKISEAVLDNIDLPAIKVQYSEYQVEAAKAASKSIGWSLAPSDVWLLAHGVNCTKFHTEVIPFKRGETGVRACLTPYYMSYENE